MHLQRPLQNHLYVVWDYMQIFHKLGETNQVILVWIFGHQGTSCNEKVDGLAKLGTEMAEPSEFLLR